MTFFNFLSLFGVGRYVIGTIGAGNVSNCPGNLSFGVGNVSNCVGNVSFGAVNVSICPGNGSFSAGIAAKWIIQSTGYRPFCKP